MVNPIGKVNDVLKAVTNGTALEFSTDQLAAFGSGVSTHLQRQTTPKNKQRTEKTLWFSEVGKPCHRQVWYQHDDTESEPLHPNTIVKFLYGDVVEELALTLIQASGQEVTRRQETVEVVLGGVAQGWKVRGRIDAFINGTLTDVKSCSSRAYDSYVKGGVSNNDSFGYMQQLLGYAVATGEKAGAFLLVNKETGAMHWDPYVFTDKQLSDWVKNAEELAGKIEMAVPPTRHFTPTAYGKSGNEALPYQCGYCAYKSPCWNNVCSTKTGGLEGFLYSGKPVWFTKVIREPDVPRIVTNGEA